MADIRNILLEVVGKSDSAQRSLETLATTLRAVPDAKTIEIRAEIDEARKNIAAALADLKAIDRSEVDAEVRVEITRAIHELEGFDATLDDVDGRQVTATLAIEAQRRDLDEALAGAQASLDRLVARSPVVAIDAKITDAEAAIARLEAELAGVPARVSIDFDVRAAELAAALAEAQAVLDGLTADPRVVGIDASIVEAEVKIARLQAEIAAVPERVNVEIDARAAGLTAELAKARGALARLGDGSEVRRLEAAIEQAGARADIAREKMEKFAASSKVDPTKLRDLTAAVGVADAKLDALTEKRRQVIVDIEADTRDIEATIARVDVELAALPERRDIEIQATVSGLEATLAKTRLLLDAATARRDKIVLQFDAKIEKAMANVLTLEDELASIPEQESIEVTLQADKLRGQVAAAKANVATLTEQRRDVVIGFDARTATAEAKVAALTAKVAAVPDQKNIDIGVNQSIVGDLERIDGGFNKIRGVIGKLTPETSRLGEALGSTTTRIGVGIFSFGVSLGPVLAGVIALAVAIGTSLVAALVALAASFALAAAAAAALGTALIAALGPVLGLVIAVITRIIAVAKALKAQQAATQSAAQTAIQGSRAAAAAQQQQTDAARTLGEAQAAMGRASEAAYQEVADAAENASDAIRGIGDAQLSLEDAKLSVKEAELALRELTSTADDSRAALVDKFTDISVSFDSSSIEKAVKGGGGSDEDALAIERAVLRVRQARQAEKNAVDGVSDAERKRSRAIEENNRFLEQGIEASSGYQAAAKGVEDAQRGVARAAESAADATEAIAASTAKATVLVGALSAREREFLKTLQAVRKELRGAFVRATDAVFGGLITALGRLPKLVNPLRGAFARLGKNISNALDIFSGELIRPEWISAIRKFILAGGRIAQVFTADILVPFLRIVRDVALGALPFLERGLKLAGAALKRLSDSAGPTRVSEVIATLVGHLKSWLELAKQIGRVFLAVVRGAAGEGRTLVDVLADGARKLADFLGSTNGQEELKQFFADVVPNAKEFLKVVFELALAFIAFGRDVQPILTAVLVPLGKILELIGRILNFGGDILSVVFGGSAVDRQANAVERLKDAENDLRDAQERAADSQRDLTDARNEARRAIEDATDAAKGARLDKRRASLEVKQARERLRAIDANPKAKKDDRERASIDLAEAKQRLEDATLAETEAQKGSNKAQRDGITNSPIYLREMQKQKDLRADIQEADKRRQGARGEVSANANKRAPIPPLGTVVSEAVDQSNSIVRDAGESIGKNLLSGMTSGFSLQGVIDAIGRVIGGMIRAVKDLLGIKSPSTVFAKIGGDIIRGLRDGVAEAFGIVIAKFREKINAAIQVVRDKFEAMKTAGATLGRRLVDGIRSGLSGLAGLGKTIVNGIIGVVNRGLELINKITKAGSKIPVIGGKIAKIRFQPIPELASGGIVSKGTAFIAGEAGDEAVLPLNRRVLRELAQQIVGSLGAFPTSPAVASGARGALAGAGAAGGFGGTTIEKLIVPLKVPAGEQPDIMATAVGIGRLVERHAHGSPRN